MGPFELEGAVGPRSVGNAVLREEAERPIEPCLGPPLPAETVSLAGPHQMVPNLLLDPVSNVREAPARMADRKYCTATQNRVDLRNHLAEGPGPLAAENLLERAQQRRPLFHPRVRRGIHRSRRLRIRRKSKPRNPKLSPCVRSTRRVFSSFTSTWSVANSSRSRRSTAARSRRWRGCPSTRTTRSSANLAYSTYVHRSTRVTFFARSSILSTSLRYTLLSNGEITPPCGTPC